MAINNILTKDEIAESISAIQKPPEVSKALERLKLKRENEKKAQESRKNQAALEAQKVEFEKQMVRKKAGFALLEGNIIETEHLLMTMYDVTQIDYTTWLKLAKCHGRIFLDSVKDNRARNMAFCKALDLDPWNNDTWTHLSIRLTFLGLEKGARGAMDMAMGKPSIKRGDKKQLGKFLLEFGAEKAVIRVLGPNQ